MEVFGGNTLLSPAFKQSERSTRRGRTRGRSGTTEREELEKKIMATRLLILLFALVALASADDVLQLNDADFDGKVASYDTVLVMFYAPW